MASSQPLLIDLLMGEPVPFQMFLDDISTARVVYLGELHTIARHHRLQTQVLEALADRGMQIALGMEMFSREQQPVLDKWQQGSHSVDNLIEELGKERWTNLKDYAQVLTLARERKIPVIGLNARDSVVRKVAREGIEGLTENELKELPPDLSEISPLNDRLLRLRLRVHKAFEAKSLDRVVLAQALRDATMAGAVAAYLGSPEGKDRLMVVIAGSGHINYGFGIPERVQKLNGLPYRIILPTESGELVLSEEEKRQAMPVHITHEDLRFIRVPIADYLHVIPLKDDSPASEPAELASAPVDAH
ncbi:MAG: ChaN family lipoprotein [Desulfomonile tiedjei]|nr:ChaN family lipoprotein [Desulfomonile tiedjei]